MPIVIGDQTMRGRHIGGKVVHALIQRAKELGYDCIYVDEIYEYNTGSRRCFEAAEFQVYEKTEKGKRYYLKLA